MIKSLSWRWRDVIRQRFYVHPHWDQTQPLDEFKNGRQLFSDGTLFNDTVRRFKGLQAPCIILTEVDFDELDDQTKSLLYLGMTRASMSLKIVLTDAFAQKLATCLWVIQAATIVHNVENS